MITVLVRSAVLASFALSGSACVGRSADGPGQPDLVGDDDDDDDDPCDEPDACVVLLSINPTVQNFGSVSVGETSAPQLFTVTSSGAADSQSGALTTSTTGDFFITESACATSLRGGESCAFSLVFAPSAGGARSGNVTVSAADIDGAVSASVTGSGASGDDYCTINPSSANFGDVVVGATSGAQPFTVTNNGDDDTGVLAVALGGANFSQFVVVTDACTGETLAAGASCEVTIAFQPAGAGTAVATFLVDGDESVPVSAALSGTGLFDDSVLLNISPTLRDFGSVPTGSDGAELSFIVTNSGDVASGILTTSLGGADAPSFFISSSTCSDASLVGGESCTIGVTFSPTGAGGPRSAFLEVSATPGSTLTASLTGFATDEDGFTVNPLVHDFGVLELGTTTAPVEFTVSRCCTGATGSLAVSLSGQDASSFVIVTDACSGAPLVGEAECAFTIAFAPERVGTVTASVSVTDAASGHVEVVALTGSGTS